MTDLRRISYLSALTAIPTIIFFSLLNFNLVSIYFTVTFLLSFAYLLSQENPLLPMSFFISQALVIFVLKGGFLFYHIGTLLCIILFVNYYLRTKKKIFKSNFLIVFFLIYGLISAFNLSSYTGLMKFLDVICVIFLVQFLYKNYNLFKHSFFLFGLYACFMSLAIAFFGFRDFLFLEDLRNFEFSGINPISLGMSIGLFLSCIVISKDKFLPNFLIKNNFRFSLFVFFVFLSLFLSTSRAGLLSFVITYLISTLFIGNYKFSIYMILLLFIFTSVLFLDNFDIINIAKEYTFDRNFTSSYDLDKISTGRVSMYEAVFGAIKDNKYIFLGEGPGLSANNDIYHNRLVLHSFSLKLIVEIGLFLTIFVFYRLFKYFKESIYLLRYKNFALPFIGLTFWFFCSLTVTGIDLLGGISLSFVFLRPID
jgi:hypothetical protein